MDPTDSRQAGVTPARVVLVCLALAACGAAVWAVFTYVIRDHELALAFVQALVWPTVVAAGLFWLRAPLRDKLRELLRAEGFGTSLEFQERATRRLEAELAGPFNQLGATGNEEAASGEDAEEVDLQGSAVGLDQPPGVEAVTAENQTQKPLPNEPTIVPQAAVTPSVEPLDDLEAISRALGIPEVLVQQARQRFEAEPETARRRLLEAVIKTAGHDRSFRNVKQRADTRDGIENIIRKSAAWGYDMGRAGAPQTVPDIEWNEDGTWRIVTEVPKRRRLPQWTQEGGSLRQIKALEEEIKKLEREKHNPMARASLETFGNQGWLAELKSKLAKIDPGNPWSLS